MYKIITNEMLQEARDSAGKCLSPYRFAHTEGVAAMAARLAALYCPERENELVAAALLHDITKELTGDEQLALFASHGVSLTKDERACPKIWHGMTAALVIPERFPNLATEAVVSAVRWHTTARAALTLTDALIYLADYIEEGRRHGDCVALRQRFFNAHPEKMTEAARRRHLVAVLVESLQLTMEAIRRKGEPICQATLAAYEYLKEKKTL